MTKKPVVTNGIVNLNLSTLHNVLGLLRHLAQSDLAFLYQLLEDDTKRDIVKMAHDLYNLCEEHGDFNLTKEEEVEYIDLTKLIDPDYKG